MSQIPNQIVASLLPRDETRMLEFKRLRGAELTKMLRSITAFANTAGGLLVLGMEDFARDQGADRLYGIEENEPAVDDLRRELRNRVIPPIGGDLGPEPIFHLFPPVFQLNPERESFIVILRNQSRPTIWDQVETFLEAHPTIGNAEVRQLLRTEDPIKASRQLKSWVDGGLLVVANPEGPRSQRRYTRPGTLPLQDDLFGPEGVPPEGP